MIAPLLEGNAIGADFCPVLVEYLLDMVWQR